MVAALAYVTFVLAFIGLAPLAQGLEPRADRDDLSREFAAFRRAQIASVEYDLHVMLAPELNTFDGTAELRVKLNQTNDPLSIDLRAETIHQVTVNGTLVPDITKRNGSFDIPPAYLSTNPLSIVVTYTGAYSRSRDGIIRYTDSQDGRVYVYTNLEPYGAHYVFPCFDQPDIKATLTLAITAPETWTAIGNCLPSSTTVDGGVKTTRFAPTPPLSTYLFFVGGGDYTVWHDTHRGLPLAVYARASLAEDVDYDRIFDETKAGLDYFNEYFETPYPFEKYDHVFAPDLGPGAMENPGAVTMNEYMVFRGTPTTEDFQDRNNTLLHEMAHMWFGDLVTMAWWNDLWLNESFATFSAYQAQASLGTYSGVWERFYQTKGWAYYQDQLSTTHPIEVPIASAQQAMANFDGITYAKGASALKQLWFTVGDVAYRRGVVRYFRTYAWRNATRAEFMDAIATESGVSLAEWTEAWLQSEGLSALSLEYNCADERMDRVEIIQSPINAPRLSPHKTQFALLHANPAGSLAVTRTLALDYHDSRTAVPALEGHPCPDLLFPNYGDMDYGLFYLDSRSLETALTHISSVEDPFIRRMLWGTLYTMMRNEKLGASVFMKLILENLPKESDEGMVEYLLGNRPTLDTYRQFLTLEKSQAVAPAWETLLWEGISRAPANSDTQIHWLDAYIASTSRPESLVQLRELLDPQRVPPLDQPRRWHVVQRMAALGAPDAEARVVAELDRDPSDLGKRLAFGARGAVPTLENKQLQWERLKDLELPYALQRAGASTFYNRLYPALTEAFVDAWFSYVGERDWESEQYRITLWFDSLFPPVFTEGFLARSRAALESANLPHRARRAWQESNDEVARTIAIHKFDHQSLPPR